MSSFTIYIHSGKSLKVGDKQVGTSDPYVKIREQPYASIANMSKKPKALAKTSTQKKTLNPLWCTDLNVKTSSSVLYLQVFDYDFLSPADDYLGEAVLDLNIVVPGAKLWLPVIYSVPPERPVHHGLLCVTVKEGPEVHKSWVSFPGDYPEWASSAFSGLLRMHSSLFKPSFDSNPCPSPQEVVFSVTPPGAPDSKTKISLSLHLHSEPEYHRTAMESFIKKKAPSFSSLHTCNLMMHPNMNGAIMDAIVAYEARDGVVFAIDAAIPLFSGPFLSVSIPAIDTAWLHVKLSVHPGDPFHHINTLPSLWSTFVSFGLQDLHESYLNYPDSQIAFGRNDQWKISFPPLARVSFRDEESGSVAVDPAWGTSKSPLKLALSVADESNKEALVKVNTTNLFIDEINCHRLGRTVSVHTWKDSVSEQTTKRTWMLRVDGDDKETGVLVELMYNEMSDAIALFLALMPQILGTVYCGELPSIPSKNEWNWSIQLDYDTDMTVQGKEEPTV